MAAATSPATGRRYGVAGVCGAWEVPRSSFYAARVAAQGTRPPASPARRGPKPAVSDADLLAAIRADLARSPWTGEGHRKVWARLRALDGVRVSRKRVLRLMREHTLLSPHRARPRPETSHERHITTEAPNVMWATDATQVTTVQDGKVWLFGVAEHWNAELLGWHVAKRGTRYRGHPGRRHGAAPAVRPPRRRRRPRPGAAPRPRQRLHVRRLPEADQVLGHGAELRLRRRAARRTASSSASSAP